MGKMLERRMYNKLLPAVESLKGLPDRQFGFPTDKSTFHLVASLTENAMHGRYGTNKYCTVIVLGMQNAFRSASWNLIKKRDWYTHLLNCAFQQLFNWYKALVRHRRWTQRIHCWVGVPQGYYNQHRQHACTEASRTGITMHDSDYKYRWHVLRTLFTGGKLQKNSLTKCAAHSRPFPMIQPMQLLK